MTPEFMELFLASVALQGRMAGDLRDRIRSMVWASAGQLARIALENRLVHGDFNKRNVLVRPTSGVWQFRLCKALANSNQINESRKPSPVFR